MPTSIKPSPSMPPNAPQQAHPGVRVTNTPPRDPATFQAIPVSKPSMPVGPAKAIPIKTFPGVRQGLRPAHNVDIFDSSALKTQFLPFLAHCNTCAYEARVLTLAEAISYATTHSGQ